MGRGVGEGLRAQKRRQAAAPAVADEQVGFGPRSLQKTNSELRGEDPSAVGFPREFAHGAPPSCACRIAPSVSRSIREQTTRGSRVAAFR